MVGYLENHSLEISFARLCLYVKSRAFGIRCVPNAIILNLFLDTFVHINTYLYFNIQDGRQRVSTRQSFTWFLLHVHGIRVSIESYF